MLPSLAVFPDKCFQRKEKPFWDYSDFFFFFGSCKNQNVDKAEFYSQTFCELFFSITIQWRTYHHFTQDTERVSPQKEKNLCLSDSSSFYLGPQISMFCRLPFGILSTGKGYMKLRNAHESNTLYSGNYIWEFIQFHLDLDSNTEK